MTGSDLPAVYTATDEWLRLVHHRLGNVVGILGEIRDAAVAKPEPADPPAVQPVELREPDPGPVPAAEAEPATVQLTEDRPAKPPAKRQPRKRAATK